ncbi:uncharacterized protein SCHCODRAFT_02518833, partial [Schizophyllum commune H4-8]|uniref:uncharacterized protein n=1 Tax=Schizophyllum commune (strain H4-8 / FGSC 9210) TaxID=578458 RepID=UPI00215FBB64
LTTCFATGHGTSVVYLDRAAVTKYVSVEPSAAMHGRIRRTTKNSGFAYQDGSLIIMGCRIEDIAAIRGALRGNGPCPNMLISVLALCSVPSSRVTIRALLRDPLEPVGTLLSHEHVLSHRLDVAWWHFGHLAARKEVRQSFFTQSPVH